VLEPMPRVSEHSSPVAFRHLFAKMSEAQAAKL